MTYNFDPERWFETHCAALKMRREKGEVDEQAYAEQLADLNRRYEEMQERLDGTYQIPQPEEG